MEETVVEKRSARHCPPAPSRYPWLVFGHGPRDKDDYTLKNYIFCNIFRPWETCLIKSIPELRHKTVCASCHGWLVLLGEGQYSLWNPVTFKLIQLPPLSLEPNQEVISFTLSLPPGEPDCLVVLFVEDSPLAIFCQPGDNQWSEHWYGIEKDDPVIHSVSCGGNIYARSCQDRIMEIKLDELKQLHTTWLPVEKPSFELPTLFFNTYLVESCDQLFIIYKSYRGMKCQDADVAYIQISRLDFTLMEWIKVESAKDRAFFLNGQHFAISCPAMEPIESSCIYFTLRNDKNLYSFNIEDKSLSVSSPCQNLPTPWYSPFWVMPDLGLNDTANVKEIENHVKKVEAVKAGESHWSDLPLDILEEIAKRLSMFDYLDFRAVNRVCRLAAPPIQWRKILNESLSPWLVFCENDKGVCIIIDPNYNRRYILTLPESLFGTTIWFSKDDWLLMSKFEHYYYLFCYNPFTKATIKLPELPPLSMFASLSFGFSSSPTSSDCVVIGTSFERHSVVISFIRFGEHEWTQFEYENNLDFKANFISPVSYDGAFYFLGAEGNLGVFVPEGEGEWEVLDKPHKPCNSYHQCFLLECNGELLSIFMGFMGKWIRVFRLNSSTMAWIEVENLGNYMLYVSRSSSFSAVAKTQGMENKIYFPRFCGKSIVYYSLDTKKYHSLDSMDTMVDFYNTREQLLCAWIVP